MSLAFTEEQKGIRKAPRKFTSNHVAPFDAQMNREDHINKDILRKMIRQGLRGHIGEAEPEVLRLLVARELLR